MAKAILVTAFLFAILSIASADVTFDDPSFSEAPVEVLNSSDTANFSSIYVSRYIDDTYVALWGFYPDGDTYPVTYNADLRLLNASDLTPVGNDTSVILNFTISSDLFYTGSENGYVSLAGVTEQVVGNITNTTTNATTNVTQTSITAIIFSSDSNDTSSFKTVTFAATTNSNISYTLYSLWFDTDYFYIAYVTTVNGVETSVYLVGYNKDGSSKFSYPLQLNTVNLTGTSKVKAKSRGNTLAAAWKQVTQGLVVSVEVDLGSSVVGSEVSISTDTATTVFLPAGVVFSDEYYVILNYQQVSNLNVGFSVFPQGGNTSYPLNWNLTTGYSTAKLTSSGQYWDGWFITTRQTNQSANTISGTEETIQVYNYTAAVASNSSNTTTPANSTIVASNATVELLLLLEGSIIQGFSLPNQSYYILELNNLLGTTYPWTSGSIGQVLYQISDLYASVLQSALTTIFALVAFFLMI